MSAISSEAGPRVAIFRDHLLPPSQTFVCNQGEALREFRAYYFGCRMVPGIALPIERTLVLNEGTAVGWMREARLKVLSQAPFLKRAWSRMAPVLVHAHFGTDGALILPLVRALKLPLIVTFHGYEVTCRDEIARGSHRTHRLYLRRRGSLQRVTSRCIAVSNFIRRRLVEQGFPAERTVTHYVGIDTALFRPDETVPRGHSVLFVGRLVEQKGVQYLIRAIQLLEPLHPGIELIVIGDGPMRQALEAAAAASLSKYRFLGMQPSDTVRWWMNRAAVFCAPSVTDATGEEEAFGIGCAEAQAMALPVVASESGGMVEAVGHGETGFLAPERDAERLAQYIGLLLADPALRARFGAAGRKRVLETFDLARQTVTLEELYRTVGSEQPLY